MPLGIDPTRVDTTQQFPLGYETDDPRGGIFAGNKLKYGKANGTITAADICKLDITATAADRRGVFIRNAAAAEPIEGIALASLTANQFGWFTTLGLFQNANVTTGAVAGAILSSSGTAGRAITSPGAAADANANAGGRRLLNLVLAASNVADVLIGG